MMEVDAQTVIRMLQGQSSVKAGLSVILNDSLHLASCFNTVSFHFVSRDCNRVSNALAKHALHLALPTSWQGEFLSWVL